LLAGLDIVHVGPGGGAVLICTPMDLSILEDADLPYEVRILDLESHCEQRLL